MAVQLNILVQIEMGESPSLSGGPWLAVDEDELSPRGNYLVWMMIGLKIKISNNQIYLFF